MQRSLQGDRQKRLPRAKTKKPADRAGLPVLALVFC